ncbi:MAG: rhomboid family intramembrane serine protease [Alphaproteobacteria bacterium]|nr:rhomboid family intramembrane serine protease [Alphaproteobacteria bacterium]
MPQPQRQPILNIPPATKALLVANIVVHGLRQLLPDTLDDWIVMNFGFVPGRYTTPGAFSWTALLSPLTHQFLHANLAHLGMNMLALLAFGAGVERRLGSLKMLVFTLVCGLFGAAVHFAVYPHSFDPVIGASGAISGLFGAVMRFQLRGGRNGSIWPMVGLFLVLNFVTGVAGVGAPEGETVAWVAHTGGFLAGLFLFGLFDRHAPQLRA